MHSHRVLVVEAIGIAVALALAGCSDAASAPMGGMGNTGSPKSGGSNNGSSGSGNSASPGANGGSANPSPGSGAQPSSNTTADETWQTGKQITSSLTIAPNVVVAIAPGAQITIADQVTITVQGTLRSEGGQGTNAKLGGKSWGGLVIATGGTLSLSGVDIENASVALDTKSGNVDATYANGTINVATTPFNVEAGSKLTMSHATVVGTLGSSTVNGSFTASYLDYDANSHEGITIGNASAAFSVDDSRFHSAGTSSGDMIVSEQAASLHVGHTEIQKCHCAFHFNDVTSFDLSAMDVHDDAYAFMMFGSNPGSGTRTVKDSNFHALDVGVAESGTNGPITLSNCYFSGVNTQAELIDAEIKVGTSNSPVSGVGPR